MRTSDERYLWYVQQNDPVQIGTGLDKYRNDVRRWQEARARAELWLASVGAKYKVSKPNPP